jgi:hypothetical protein
MNAVVTKPFRGCLPGMVYPKNFEVGDKLTGQFAQDMVAGGHAEFTSHYDAPENKDAARFRTTGVDGRNDSDNSERAEPQRRRGRPRKNGA